MGERAEVDFGGRARSLKLCPLGSKEPLIVFKVRRGGCISKSTLYWLLSSPLSSPVHPSILSPGRLVLGILQITLFCYLVLLESSTGDWTRTGERDRDSLLSGDFLALSVTLPQHSCFWLSQTLLMRPLGGYQYLPGTVPSSKSESSSQGLSPNHPASKNPSLRPLFTQP